METRKETKTYTKEVVTYIASDGTEFSSCDECEKYEDSADCAIKMDLNRFRSNNTIINGERIIFGSYDGESFGVELNDNDALYAVRVFFKHKGNKYAAESLTDDMIGKKIVISDNGCDEYYFYTYDEMISRINKLFETEVK